MRRKVLRSYSWIKKEGWDSWPVFWVIKTSFRLYMVKNIPFRSGFLLEVTLRRFFSLENGTL
jgi:hypothetical protein